MNTKSYTYVIDYQEKEHGEWNHMIVEAKSLVLLNRYINKEWHEYEISQLLKDYDI